MTQHVLLYPGPTSDNLARVPAALTQRTQWVLWRGVEKVDEDTGEIRLNKSPHDPQTLTKASTIDPATWGHVRLLCGPPARRPGHWELEELQLHGGGIAMCSVTTIPTPGSTLIAVSTR